MLLPALLFAAATADEPAVPLVLRLEDQANAIWTALPTDAADPRLTRMDDAPAECVATALAEARRLLAKDEGARAALRDVALTRPATRSEVVAQPLGASCGAFYDVRDGEGGLVLSLRLEAGCGCTERGVRVHLVGHAPLTPGVLESKDVQRLRAGEPRYEVLASCEPCAAGGPPRRASLPAGGDPCASLCAPLAEGLAAWQQKLTAAAARLGDLAGKATTLQLQVTSDQKELTGAQSARSKPRAVLERISALQARIKSAQDELQRVQRASQDAERIVSALRRVAGDTQGAEGSCRTQCQARPPQQRASTPQAGGTASAAGGGGLSTGVLVAGGAALAAGGAVALAARGSDSPASSGPADFSGTWRGTRVVVATVNPPDLCTRVFDETWEISQDGRALTAAVTSTAQGCGNQPACGQCSLFPFPRPHTGTAEGTTARFYPFPELQTPSCVLPLTLRGATMSGFMPSCVAPPNPLTISHDVTLQRVTR